MSHKRKKHRIYKTLERRQFCQPVGGSIYPTALRFFGMDTNFFANLFILWERRINCASPGVSFSEKDSLCTELSAKVEPSDFKNDSPVSKRWKSSYNTLFLNCYTTFCGSDNHFWRGNTFLKHFRQNNTKLIHNKPVIVENSEVSHRSGRKSKSPHDMPACNYFFF